MSDTPAPACLSIDNYVLSTVVTYKVPIEVTGTPKPVIIGRDPDRRRQGWFAYQVMGAMNLHCLRADGTWHKYGEPFPTAQAALDAVIASPFKRWGHDALGYGMDRTAPKDGESA